jgi:hypothetical protein
MKALMSAPRTRIGAMMREMEMPAARKATSSRWRERLPMEKTEASRMAMGEIRYTICGR